MTGEAPVVLHASCVAVGERGMLILGPSGAGKSSLALQLMALGASLVADDRVEVVLIDNAPVARCPTPLRGLVEARGVGLLRSPFRESTRIDLVVDLHQTETSRLPEPHEYELLGCPINLVCGSAGAHFPAALLLYLREGRAA